MIPAEEFNLWPLPTTGTINQVNHVLAEDGVTLLLYVCFEDGRVIIVQAAPGSDLEIYESILPGNPI